MGRARYIVVEGPIGVGKTSLARRLGASLQGALMLERPEDNPFLDRFYRNPRDAALPTQLFFLFQRAGQLEALQQEDMFAAARVADFMFEKDALFAELTLTRHELDLYRQVWRSLELRPPPPDLVIYLQAPVDVLLSRIARRGIDFEQRISRAYLEQLTEAYARFFHAWEDSPLLIVNAAAIDPVNNDREYEELLGAIQRIDKGRHFYNPAGRGIV